MTILNTTALRQYAKESEYRDLWWFCINEVVSQEAVPLRLIPKEATILVLNDDAKNQGKEEWFVFRYPGYKTEEEIVSIALKEKLAREPSAKQKVALEFFGRDSSRISREEASALLDKFFESDYNYDAYNEFKWKNRARLWNRQEILAEAFRRLQTKAFKVREKIAEAKVSAILNDANQRDVDEINLLAFIESNYPEALLGGSSAAKKKREQAYYSEFSSSNTKQQKKGCLGLLLLCLVPIGGGCLLASKIFF